MECGRGGGLLIWQREVGRRQPGSGGVVGREAGSRRRGTFSLTRCSFHTALCSLVIRICYIPRRVSNVVLV